MHQNIENGREFIELFLSDRKIAFDKALTSKRLSFFEDIVINSFEKKLSEESLDEIFAILVAFFIEKQRLYDIASLYMYVKSYSLRNDWKGITSIQKALTEKINKLFVVSLTYRSREIDFMFLDLVGNDIKALIKMLSAVFAVTPMFNTPFPEHLWIKFVEIADQDIKNFVEESGTYFLAFYLYKMPKMVYLISEEHVEKWARLILNPTTQDIHIHKILEAMEIKPSPEILFMLMLINREKERGDALNILWSYTTLSNNIVRREYSDKITLFLKKILDSSFYDIDKISQTQKKMIANIIRAYGCSSLIPDLFAIIDKPVNLNASKKIETIKIFSLVISSFAASDASILQKLKELLNKDYIAESVKKLISGQIISISKELKKQ